MVWRCNLHYEKFSDGTVKCIEDEIPFEIPDGWAWARLGTIAETELGKMLDASKNKGAPRQYLRNINVRWGSFDLSDLLEMRIQDSEIERYSICKGDLVVCEGGEPGRCAIWREDEPVFFQKALHRVRPFVASSEFLYYLFRAIMATAQMEKYYTGTTIKHLTGQALKSLPVPLPPSNEQVRIIEKLHQLSAFLDYMEKTQTSFGVELNGLKAKILDLAIRGKLVPQDPADEPASVLLECIRADKEEQIKAGKIKRDKKESFIFRGEDNSYYEKIGDEVRCIDDQLPFNIPENWAWARLGSIFTLLSGRDLAPDDYNDEENGIPYITGASNFMNGQIGYFRWTTKPQVVSDYGDLLLTCKGTVGELAINTVGSVHIARQIMAISGTSHLNQKYLFICIMAYISRIRASAKGLIPGISREDILELVLPIPPKRHQGLIVEKVDSLLLLLGTIEQSLK